MARMIVVQKSGVLPTSLMTVCSRNSSSDGSVGVPPWFHNALMCWATRAASNHLAALGVDIARQSQSDEGQRAITVVRGLQVLEPDVGHNAAQTRRSSCW